MTCPRLSRLIGIPTTFASLVACAAATTGAPVVPGPVVQSSTVHNATTPSREIHWFRNSAEARGIYLEVYRLAGEQLDRLAAGAAPQTWAVIMDADETLVDNSTFQKEQAGAPYSEVAWGSWVARKAAPALPGAVEFTRLIHRLGGRLAIVTNRDNRYCDATRENLKSDSIEADIVLCRTTTSDKNPRFQSVAGGTASPSLSALKVLMWVGDNIQDFPNLTQRVRDGRDADYDQFGRTYILLPNPMYGSWEKQAYR